MLLPLLNSANLICHKEFKSTAHLGCLHEHLHVDSSRLFCCPSVWRGRRFCFNWRSIEFVGIPGCCQRRLLVGLRRRFGLESLEYLRLGGWRNTWIHCFQLYVTALRWVVAISPAVYVPNHLWAFIEKLGWSRSWFVCFASIAERIHCPSPGIPIFPTDIIKWWTAGLNLFLSFPLRHTFLSRLSDLTMKMSCTGWSCYRWRKTKIMSILETSTGRAETVNWFTKMALPLPGQCSSWGWREERGSLLCRASRNLDLKWHFWHSGDWAGSKVCCWRGWGEHAEQQRCRGVRLESNQR